MGVLQSFMVISSIWWILYLWKVIKLDVKKKNFCIYWVLPLSWFQPNSLAKLFPNPPTTKSLSVKIKLNHDFSCAATLCLLSVRWMNCALAFPLLSLSQTLRRYIYTNTTFYHSLTLMGAHQVSSKYIEVERRLTSLTTPRRKKQTVN